jgi:hypothetical protein
MVDEVAMKARRRSEKMENLYIIIVDSQKDTSDELLER